MVYHGIGSKAIQGPTVDTMPIVAHPRSSRLVWFAVLKAKRKIGTERREQKTRGCVTSEIEVPPRFEPGSEAAVKS